MIVNFYTPNHGQITLGGYDLKTIDKKAIRQYINYLPQQSYVFSGTILENLTLGAPDNITQEEILKACVSRNWHKLKHNLRKLLKKKKICKRSLTTQISPKLTPF